MQNLFHILLQSLVVHGQRGEGSTTSLAKLGGIRDDLGEPHAGSLDTPPDATDSGGTPSTDARGTGIQEHKPTIQPPVVLRT